MELCIVRPVLLILCQSFIFLSDFLQFYFGVSVLFEAGLLSVAEGDRIKGFELVGVRSLGENPC